MPRKSKQKQRFSKHNARYKRRKQRGGFLGFLHRRGTNVINVMKNAPGEINNIAQQRIQQAIREDDK